MLKTQIPKSPAVEPPAPIPIAEPTTAFPPSAELGDQLGHLADTQAAIDRKKAEELARLRAIQNRD